MRFTDLNVDRFGILRNTELTALSPGLNVIYGANGSGKTTLVSFVHGLLFGYTTEHQGFQAADQDFGGSLNIAVNEQTWQWSREYRGGVSSELMVCDPETGRRLTSSGPHLPAWVNENVFREIFCVGYQEAARFDLLTRLCLAETGPVGSPEEISRTRAALDECIAQRDGSTVRGGLRQHLSDLHRRRQTLARELQELGKIDPEVPQQIQRLENEQQQLRQRLADARTHQLTVREDIRRLEQTLLQLRRRNVVSLDRASIEKQIQSLSARQHRWHEIEIAISAELQELAATQDIDRTGTDAILSLRALVDRLEHRAQPEGSSALKSAERRLAAAHSLTDANVRAELASLCDYLTQHEAAVAAAAHAVEQELALRSLGSCQQLQSALKQRLDVLRNELARSQNVLGRSRLPATDSAGCTADVHDQVVDNDVLPHRTESDIEAELTLLSSRLSQLEADEQSLQISLERILRQLQELRSQSRPAATLEDLDAVRAQLASVDAEAEQLEEQIRTLDQTEADLRQLLQRLTEQRRSNVLGRASQLIRQLTDGDCSELLISENGSAIQAMTRQSTEPRGLQQLSRGVRDLVALALRLALIEERAASHGRCPLILDDVFVSADDDSATAAVDLLIQLGASGQQILFLTCQNDVRELFLERGVRLRHLGETEPVAERAQPVEATPALPAPAPLLAKIDPEPHDGNTNWLFYLETDSPISDLAGLTVAELEAFRAAGVVCVDDLLRPAVDDLEARFQHSGYAVSRERLRAWRGQAELSTRIPMLRRSDAELLFAAGIQSATELSRMRPEAVYDVVVEFQQSQAGRRYLRSGRSIDRQQAINWSRWAQHARSLNEARRSRSCYFSTPGDTASPQSSSRASGSHSTARRRRQRRIAETGRISRRQLRPQLSESARRERLKRHAQRRDRLRRRAASNRTRLSTAENGHREPRFYLNRSDDVEAAPSIGPRTAQRLTAAGIYTVDDLLKASPDEVAEKLGNRRINADVIALWQSQARLMCQVPELRGHDVQILVACGITEADQLSSKRPADLYSIVAPFSETSEGERIIRGGKKPDLEEVTDWISCAQNARPLKAAA